jgi:hypothetical protein
MRGDRPASARSTAAGSGGVSSGVSMDAIGAAGDSRGSAPALAIGAVDSSSALPLARHEGGQHRLDGEGAAALHRHAEWRPAAGMLGQPLAAPRG